MRGIVDTRLLGKPKSFGGKDEEWSMWSVILRAYIGAVSPKLLKMMERTEALTEPVVQSMMDEEERAHDTQLYFILAMLCEGRAQDKVACCPYGHGLELWRQLVLQYEPRIASRHAGLLQAILNFKFEDDFVSAFEKRERVIRQYETAVGHKFVDDVKMGIVIKGMPPQSNVATHLMLNSSKYEDYVAMRQEVMEIVRTQKVISSGPLPWCPHSE